MIIKKYWNAKDSFRTTDLKCVCIKKPYVLIGKSDVKEWTNLISAEEMMDYLCTTLSEVWMQKILMHQRAVMSIWAVSHLSYEHAFISTAIVNGSFFLFFSSKKMRSLKRDAGYVTGPLVLVSPNRICDMSSLREWNIAFLLPFSLKFLTQQFTHFLKIEAVSRQTASCHHAGTISTDRQAGMWKCF